MFEGKQKVDKRNDGYLEMRSRDDPFRSWKVRHVTVQSQGHASGHLGSAEYGSVMRAERCEDREEE